MTIYILKTTNGEDRSYFSEKALINDVLASNLIIDTVMIEYSPSHAGEPSPIFDVTHQVKYQLRKRLKFFLSSLKGGEDP